MAWIILVIAGILEVGWASMLPATRGLTRPAPTAAFLVLLTGSMVLLAQAARTIPLGTAYGVWVGIGTVGAVIVGIVAYGEPLGMGRMLFLGLLCASIVGLKVTAA